MAEKKPVIVIEANAWWEKSGSKYAKCGYSGGWEITRCKNYPDINGGHYSPNFTDTPQSIKEYFINQYSERFDKKYRVIVNLKIIKDERNPTMESFF